MENVEKQSWKSFFKLIVKSNLPWHLYIIAFITSLFGTKIALGLPIVMAEIYSGNIFDKALIWRVIYLSILSVIGYSSTSFFYKIAAATTPRNIRYSLWSKIIRVPMSYYNEQPGLTLVSRVTSDPGFINSIIAESFAIINTTYAFVGAIAIMYGMNAKLTWALMPIIPYMIIVTFGIGHFSQKAQFRLQGRYSGLTAYFAERLPKIRLIKMFSKERAELAHADKVVTEQYEAEKYKSIVELVSEPLMESVQAITVGIVLIYGGILVTRGELETGEVVAFYMYIANIHNAILKYGLYIKSLKIAKGASEKIIEIIDGEDEQVIREKTFANVLENSNGDIKFENVTFGYNEKIVLKNINLTIPERKVTAIVGPSGGGKTTIFNLLERFYEPNSGKILLGETPVEKIHLDEWRTYFSEVSQSSPLLSGTIRENITYGVHHEVSEEELIQAADLADALSFIQKFPDGFDAEVGELASKLSGGQRQRLALTRAFMTNPEYLLLDEATASLDGRSEVEVYNGIERLMEGRTTIVIAHNLGTIINADQIVVVDDGKISGIGTHKDLVRENKLYKELIDIELEKEEKLKGSKK